MSTISSGTTSTTTLIHSGDTTGSLVFKTNDTGSGGTEAMRIDTSQNVGIGTTSPYSNASFASLTLGGTSSSKTGLIALVTNAGVDSAHIDVYNSQLRISTNGTSNPIAFYTGGSVSQNMTLDSSGNVGIGTNSPAYKLDVSGPASVTSFTGTTKLGAVVRGSTGSTDYSGIDFIGNSQTNPVARIAVLTGGSGSTLSFGTSNSYASGITNTAMSIDASGNLQFNSGNGSVAIAYGCRAWVNFNGTAASPITPRANGNVSSVTKNATGDYTLNFTNALADSNYSAVITNVGLAASDTRRNSVIAGAEGSGATTMTTTALRINVGNPASASLSDNAVMCVAVFR